jgi:hypothetical protein
MGIEDLITGKYGGYLLCHHVQTGCVAHPASCPVGTGGFFLGFKSPARHALSAGVEAAMRGDVHLHRVVLTVTTLFYMYVYCSLTHSWSRALLEKLPIVQLLENFPAFYGTRRFITAFT